MKVSMRTDYEIAAFILVMFFCWQIVRQERQDSYWRGYRQALKESSCRLAQENYEMAVSLKDEEIIKLSKKVLDEICGGKSPDAE